MSSQPVTPMPIPAQPEETKSSIAPDITATVAPTLPNPTPISTSAAVTPAAPPAPTDEPAVPDTPLEPASEDELKNVYIFGDAKADRDRLEAQTRLFSTYLRENAQRFVRTTVHNILDVGCGEGQLTLMLSRVFPQAHIVGMDSDPSAIELAKKRLSQAPGITGKIEFVVGDAQEALPEGQYDLVYASLVMLHLRHPEKTMALILDALCPGGYIWLKDTHESGKSSVPHPGWVKMVEVAMETMNKIGRDMFGSRKFAEQLATIGFTNVDEKLEVYPVSNSTFAGRISMGITLAGLYNAKRLIAQMGVMSEEDYVKLHKEVSDQANTLRGKVTFTNIIARKPLPGELTDDTLDSDTEPPATPHDQPVAASPTPPATPNDKLANA